MKSHLKRHAMPKTWPVLRKEQTFITCPHPSGHKRSLSIPLIVVLRDVLGLCQNGKEVKLALKEKGVLVDGKARIDKRYSVGVFDVLSLPSLKRNLRVVIDRKGRLKLIDIDEKETSLKICKVIRKTMICGGKIQLCFHDGRTLLVKDNKVRVGDSVMLSLPDAKISSVIPLKVGVQVMLTSGRHSGTVGSVKELSDSSLVFEGPDKKIVQTLKDYAIVVGETKPLITVASHE